MKIPQNKIEEQISQLQEYSISTPHFHNMQRQKREWPFNGHETSSSETMNKSRVGARERATKQ